jgi:hypothetical protein
MMPTLVEYENFVYSLQENYKSIKFSTLVVKRTSPHTAQIIGKIVFENNIFLRVFESVNFRRGRIADYGYEVYRGTEKLYWYDCWPHPDDPSLSSTFPHHKHIPPDIKHHRIPATILSFEEPNLPALIREIEELIPTL